MDGKIDQIVTDQINYYFAVEINQRTLLNEGNRVFPHYFSQLTRTNRSYSSLHI